MPVTVQIPDLLTYRSRELSGFIALPATRAMTD
jgi:hypothetical protein